MDKSFTADRYLDEVLIIISRHSNSSYAIAIQQVRLLFNNKLNFEITEGYLDLICRKLEADKYLIFNHNTRDLILTFDGLYFIQNGGYQKKKKKEYWENYPKSNWFVYCKSQLN